MTLIRLIVLSFFFWSDHSETFKAFADKKELFRKKDRNIKFYTARKWFIKTYYIIDLRIVYSSNLQIVCAFGHNRIFGLWFKYHSQVSLFEYPNSYYYEDLSFIPEASFLNTFSSL